jgi:ABC-type lipoprotein export system ATPase subunit
LINDPVLILADEPTGHLDRRAGLEVMSLLSELHAEGRTILLVTHDDAVAAYAKRELHLQDGQILEAHQASSAVLDRAVEGER